MKKIIMGFLFLLPVIVSAEIGMKTVQPSERGFTAQAIIESGERGGMLIPQGTDFTEVYNREMGEAMELWNAHRWNEAYDRFDKIVRLHPDSPWAAEAELHMSGVNKYNERYDDAEAQLISVLKKYPDNEQLARKVLQYLPHLYYQTGRFQAAQAVLQRMEQYPLTWKETQYIENWQRIISAAQFREENDRLCGTKALALAQAARAQGASLRNVSMKEVYAGFPPAEQKAKHPDGYSLSELASLGNGIPLTISYAVLKTAAQPSSPVLVFLDAPSAPRAFAEGFCPVPKDYSAPSGHFVAVESADDFTVTVLDPSGGRVRWKATAFQFRWKGIAVRLSGQALTGTSVAAKQAASMRGGCCCNPPPDPTDDPGADADASGPAGQCGGCTTCGGGGGHGAPIYQFGTGSANLQLLDTPMWYSATAKGPGLELQLTYNRVATDRMAQYTNVNYNLFGPKWSCNLSSYLTETPDGGVDIVLPGGRMERFNIVTNKYVAEDVWNENELVNEGGYFKYTLNDSRLSYWFNTSTLTNQHLEKMVDRYNNQLRFQYDSIERLTNVVDAAGRYITLLYNTSGCVTQTVDRLGRTCSFSYENGILTAITDMGGYTTTIAYTTNMWATNLVYPGDKTLSFSYPTNSIDGYYPLRISAEDALHYTNLFTYYGLNAEGPTTIKDQEGNCWGYGRDPVGQRINEDWVNTRAVINHITPLEGNIWENREYDTSANLHLRTRTNGLTINYTYDSRHNLTNEIRTINGNPHSAWSYNYDTNDNLTVIRDPLSHTNRFGYDANRRLTSITNALNGVVRFKYNTDGKLTNLTDQLNHSIGMSCDTNGFLISVAFTNGTKMIFTNDVIGRPYSFTDTAGLTVTYGYDDLDRVTAVNFPDGTSFDNEYGCCGLDRSTDRMGRNTFYQYDQLKRLEEVEDPDHNITRFRYNGLNQMTGLVTTVNGEERVKRFEHISTNGYSRLSSVVTPAGKQRQLFYDFQGRLGRYLDPQLHNQMWGYDETGRLEYQMHGYRRDTFSWDAVGNLKAVTYESVSRIQAVGFDGSGIQAPGCAASSYGYDVLNRLTNETVNLSVPGFSNVTYALQYKYDADGKVTNRVLSVSGAESESITTTYQYDSMDRTTNIIQGSGASLAKCGYTYDTAGRLQLKKYNNNDAETFLYDAESRLTNLVFTGTNTASLPVYSLSRNVMGNITQEVVAASGTVQTNLYGYDALDRLNSANVITSNGEQTVSYTYDSVGNLLFDPSSTATVYRIYSTDNELLYTSQSDLRTIEVSGTVEPGPASNKWYNSQAALGGQTVQVSQVNGSFAFTNVPVINGGSNDLQVTVCDVSGNTATQNIWYIRDTVESFRYDANGNMTYWKKPNGTETQYTYDILDRLYQVTRNGVTVLQNSYDPVGRRIAKTEVIGSTTNREYYVYEGMSVIAVLDPAGRIKESFTRGLGIAGDVGSLIAATDHTGPTNTTVYLHSDQRGNVVAARSGTNTVGTWTYDTWGEFTTNTGAYVSRFLFSSKELDRSTGFYHYGFRDYSPELKRWISADPLGEAGGLNLYAFCGNDPVNAIDPWGLACKDSYFMNVSQTMAGYLDGLLLGIIPNQDDPEFRAGQAVGDVVSFTAGFARLGYAGSAKLSSMVLRRSPTLANATKAVENRNMLKKIFRLNPWSEFRIYPYSAMSAKYGGDTLEIIKASGRTNPYLNGLGAGLIAPTGNE